MAKIICEGKTPRQINLMVKQFIAQGETNIHVISPGARHNLGVAILQQVKITFSGSVGYYCAGMIDGPDIEVKGSAGWGVAESMMGGTVVIRGNVGNGAAASIRGGSVIVHGQAAARLGVAMKGGMVMVRGDCGYMAGFMAQKGTLIVCGDTGGAFADSMYETVCFVGGRIGELGNDAVVETPTEFDLEFLKSVFSYHFTEVKNLQNFQKVVSGRKLWKFDKEEMIAWREVL